MARSIIHPKLLSRLEAHFYTSTCTIQEDTGITQDDFGAPVSNWSNLASHVDLACAISAISGPGAEVRRPDMTYVVATHRIALAGYYSSITEKMQVVVAGVTYNILLVIHDSLGKSTSLLVEVVR